MNTILILSLVLVSIHVPYGQSATKTNFHDEYDGILPRFVSDEYDCEKYKLLVRSEWVEYNCPTSMKWNQSLSLCVNYNAAEERCSSIYETSGNIDLPSGQITSPFKKEDATDLKEVDVSTIFISKVMKPNMSICSTYFHLERKLFIILFYFYIFIKFDYSLASIGKTTF